MKVVISLSEVPKHFRPAAYLMYRLSLAKPIIQTKTVLFQYARIHFEL